MMMTHPCRTRKSRVNTAFYSQLEGTYKNHSKMLFIMMSPTSISDIKRKMTTTCEQKRKEEKVQQTSTTDEEQDEKHLDNPELDELRVLSPHVSNYNGTSCRFFYQGPGEDK